LTEAALRRLWIAAVLALAAFIAWSSLAPQPPVTVEGLSDKADHLIAYLSLGLLASGIVTPPRLPFALLRCFLLGAALEVAQGLFTQERHAEWGDLAANSAGIALAWLVAGGGRAGWGLRVLARLRSRGKP
jgi:VanZ family protein